MSPGENYIHTATLQTLRTYKCLQEKTTYTLPHYRPYGHTNVSRRKLHTHCHTTDLMDIQMSPGENYIHTATLQTLRTYKCRWETTTYCHATDLMDIQMSPGENYIQMSPGENYIHTATLQTVWTYNVSLRKLHTNVPWKQLHTNHKIVLSYSHG